MKAWVFPGIAGMLAAGLFASLAQASEGPRPSSSNNWASMSSAAYPAAAAQQAAPTPSLPHYVWQEGYEHGGRWRGHWVLVR